MKKFFLLFVVLFGILYHVDAQTWIRRPLFDNEDLLITHSFIDEQELVFRKSYLAFVNKTNYNIRVTYRVTCSIWAVYANGTGTTAPYTTSYTETIYIEPNDSTTDIFLNGGISDYHRKYYWDTAGRNDGNFRISLRKFELINYGVEEKKYKTSY